MDLTVDHIYLLPIEVGQWDIYSASTVGYIYTVHGPRRQVSDGSVKLGVLRECKNGKYQAYSSANSQRAAGEAKEQWVDAVDALLRKAPAAKVKAAGLEAILED